MAGSFELIPAVEADKSSLGLCGVRAGGAIRQLERAGDVEVGTAIWLDE